MSNAFLELTAEPRTEHGKAFSRRLRRLENRIPAVVYGAGKDTLSLTLNHNHIEKALQYEAFYSQILTLTIAGKTEKVVLKDLQRHAYKPKVLHIDFLRVSATEKLTRDIPLRFIGADKAPGAKQGGVVSHQMNDVKVRCLPADLPSHIEVDITHLGLDEGIHLSQLKVPTGVELVILTQAKQGKIENDPLVVSIHIPKEEPEPGPAVEAVEGEEGAEAVAKEGEEDLNKGEAKSPEGDQDKKRKDRGDKSSKGSDKGKE